MPDRELPKWLDKTEESMLGVLKLVDGTRKTVEIVGFDDEKRQLVLEEVSPEGTTAERCASQPLIALDAVRPHRKCWPLPLVAAVVLRSPARDARSAQGISKSPPRVLDFEF